MAEHPDTLHLEQTRLIVEWPDGIEENFPLGREVTRVGRGPEDNDLAVSQDYKSISRRHFEIRRSENEFYLRDLGSGNGVLVNGQLVENVLLDDGDEIRVGVQQAGQEVRMVFKAGSEAQIRAAVSEPDTQAALAKLLLEAPPGQPYLRLRLPQGQERFFAIKKDLLVVGRDESADLRLPYAFVSARHFELRRTGPAFSIRDLSSLNGVMVNNQRLPALNPTVIHDKTIIRLEDESFGISLSLILHNPLEQSTSLDGFSLMAQPQAVAPSHALVIGRAEECDIHLGSLDVSRRHAAIRRQGAIWMLEDLGSVNGTFVDGRKVNKAELHEGSLIRIGSYVLLFQNGQLSPYQSNGLRLDVRRLSAAVTNHAGEQVGLDEISFSVLPREFVVLVGGRQSGKTRLLNALVGLSPGSGQVWLEGHDFFLNFEYYRMLFAFVPQHDVLHGSLRVEKALEYAARLRLPPNLALQERKKRITAVLETVSMNEDHLRCARICDLNLAERKRVNIAAELLNDPRLIYLDEPAAGLDTGQTKKLMHTLRQVADEGRTVVMVSQSSAYLHQVDQAGFLAQGRLVYFGPPLQALDFFEVDEFADIYERIERSGEEWRNVYQHERPESYQKYVLDRQAEIQAMPALPSQHVDLADMLHQLSVLTQRTLSVLRSQPLSIALMVLLPMLLAVLQLIGDWAPVLTAAAPGGLVENFIPYARANGFLFVMGLAAALAGLVLPLQDFLQEAPIYRRERLLNLKLPPYLLGKLVIFGTLAALQVILYLLVLSFGVEFPAQGLYWPALLEVFITLFLTTLAGLGFGLLIAAASRTTGVLLGLLLAFLFFQILFAGAFVDLRGSPLQPLVGLAPTRWSLTALGVSMDMPGLVESSVLCDAENNCSPYPAAKDDMLLDYQPAFLLRSWLALIGLFALSLAGAALVLSRRRRTAISSPAAWPGSPSSSNR